MHCKIDFSINRFLVNFHFHWWRRRKNLRLIFQKRLMIFFNIIFWWLRRDRIVDIKLIIVHIEIIIIFNIENIIV
jgi:hypothetical protein